MTELEDYKAQVRDEQRRVDRIYLILLLTCIAIAFIFGTWYGRGTHPSLGCQEDEFWTRFTPNGPACVHGEDIAEEFIR